MVQPIGSTTKPAARPIRSDGRLSRRTRKLAFIFIAFGLLTFFAPVIKVEPPISGKQEWSVLDIAQELQSRLGQENPFALLLVPFAPTYLVLLLSLGAVSFFPFQKLLLGLCAVGLFFLYPFRGVLGGLGWRLSSGRQRGAGIRPPACSKTGDGYHGLCYLEQCRRLCGWPSQSPIAGIAFPS